MTFFILHPIISGIVAALIATMVVGKWLEPLARLSSLRKISSGSSSARRTSLIPQQQIATAPPHFVSHAIAPRSSTTRHPLHPNTSSRFPLYLASIFGGLLLPYLFTHSVVISLPFLLITGAIPHVIAKRREEKWREKIQGLWPEIIDHLISGLQSGLSIAEILIDLGRRGPVETRKVFLECDRYLSIGWDLPQIFHFLKSTFADPMADQICEVLDFSRSTGARDTSITLRTLSDYIRNDIAIRSEIKSKHGWVKNSAALAAVAPWILLLLLASQPNTVNAYASGSGVTVLILGAIATIIAYLWMEKVSRLQEPPRVYI